MPRLRSGADTACPSAEAAVPPSPPQPGMAGGSSWTPAPSPSTSVSLGLGPADAADGSLKSPVVAPRRRSLRLAGAAGVASPAAPTFAPSGPDGASSGSGSGSTGKRKGRPLVVSDPVAASMNGGEFGSDGGGGEVRVLGGGGGGKVSGEGAFTSLRSGSRIAKLSMESGVHMSGEMGLGPIGSAGAGDQVHDEMLRLHEDSPGKRCRRIVVGGMEMEYVLEEDGMKMPVQLSAAPNGIEPNVVTISMGRTDEGERADPVKIGKEESGEVSISKNDIMIDEHVHRHNSAEEAIGEIIEPLAYPVGSPALDETYADIEEEGRHMTRCEVKGKGKLILGNEDSGAGTRICKFSPDSKGKGKMVVEDSSLSVGKSEDGMDLDPAISEEIQSVPIATDTSLQTWRQQAKQRVVAMAPRFAFFKADEDGHSDNDNDDTEELEPVADPQDWPGPYSTAMRIMDDREDRLRARELNSSNLDKFSNNVISWKPSKDRKSPLRSAPSLTSLCLQALSNNAEDIESLAGIPDELRNRLLTSLCHSRKMNTHRLCELLCDNPVIVQLSECSWLSEDDFQTIFGKCRTEFLQVLQLDLSGRCMPDYILPATLAKAPNCMPLLDKISLKGNYRLSDSGLDTIISAAPSLSSLNLCECSLLTSTGIKNLANKMNLVLRELYIDDCLNVDAMMILPSLQKLKHLEVLSMSGIQSVCDKFVNELIPIHGSKMKELAFAGCLKLTSSSIKTIAVNCPELSSLDLRNLSKLRDSAMRHLGNGCRLIKKLKLQRNTFSDEAVCHFLEQSGGYLTELCLNNVAKARNHTAYAIAHNCSVRLEVLDLSFCRELTNEALGLIVDSCSSLRILKLFGCTQITDVFLLGHSNSLVKIIGIEGNILEQAHCL
ncbi:hypothetical protein ABZP36_027506 [Zizania latifolia]